MLSTNLMKRPNEKVSLSSLVLTQSPWIYSSVFMLRNTSVSHMVVNTLGVISPHYYEHEDCGIF